MVKNVIGFGNAVEAMIEISVLFPTFMRRSNIFTIIQCEKD